jgi:hypothetical protein
MTTPDTLALLRKTHLVPDEESVTDDAAGASSRVYITGGGGSGKTTLARRLGPALGVDPVELDLGADLDDLAGRPAWIVEGIFVFGVGPLLDHAELIVWLDLPWRVAKRRIVTRHIYLTLVRQNRHRGLRRLVSFLHSQHRYYTQVARQALGPTDWDAITRATTIVLLAPHDTKVVRLTTPRAVRSWQRQFLKPGGGI